MGFLCFASAGRKRTEVQKGECCIDTKKTGVRKLKYRIKSRIKPANTKCLVYYKLSKCIVTLAFLLLLTPKASPLT